MREEERQIRDEKKNQSSGCEMGMFGNKKPKASLSVHIAEPNPTKLVLGKLSASSNEAALNRLETWRAIEK